MNAPTPADPAAVRLTLIAPLSGPLIPLERVPDPVFAQKINACAHLVPVESSSCIRQDMP